MVYVALTVVVWYGLACSSDVNWKNNAGNTPLLLALTHPDQRKCERHAPMFPKNCNHYLQPQVGEVGQGLWAVDCDVLRVEGCEHGSFVTINAWIAFLTHLVRASNCKLWATLYPLGLM